MPQVTRHTQKAQDALLVVRAQAGDARALAILAQERGPRLLAHAVRMLGDRDGGRDVAQEAWIDITKSLSRLQKPEAFLPWALRIVSRKTAAEIKRRQRGRKLSDAVALERQGDVEPAHDEAPDLARVRRAIDALPGDHRATIALFYLEDMSVAEVSVALDVPIGTVKTRLMHARAKLRVILEGDRHGTDG